MADKRHHGFASAAITLLLSVILGGCSAYREHLPHSAAPRPNIVYILADDLGYGDIGAYGQRQARTPILDRLAREGTAFTRHYAGSTICAPSRASLMTGLHTGHVSVRGNVEMGGYRDEEEKGQMALGLDEATLAEVLSGAGYRTAMIGKWGLGGPDSPSEPQKRGFDFAFGYLDQKQSHNYYPTHLWENGMRVPLANPFFIPHGEMAGTSMKADDYGLYMGPDYAPDFLTDAAVTWIEAQDRERPFFLYLAYNSPHAALQVPDEDLEQYAHFPETPLESGGYTPHPRPRAARAAMISRLDRDIGEVLAALDRRGLAGNTLVIFTSDNGPGSEGGADLAFFQSTGGLRGEKRDLYEGGIRVPMIARWPDRVSANRTSAHISAFWDVMPTLAELAGAAVPRTDGISFLPELLGKKQPQHDHLYWEFHEGGKRSQAVLLGDYKVIRHWSTGGKGRQSVEVFDVSADPSETSDISASRPDLVARAIKVMDRRSRSRIDKFNF